MLSSNEALKELSSMRRLMVMETPEILTSWVIMVSLRLLSYILVKCVIKVLRKITISKYTSVFTAAKSHIRVSHVKKALDPTVL